ncbi:MAG: hypothetical protein OEZ32_00885 [Nitrospinota bacterium]|nr:hypothetical protein [Nitrospinota bacterium]
MWNKEGPPGDGGCGRGADPGGPGAWPSRKKKPKGAPPGKAPVHGAKSVSARIDEAAIKAMRVK